MVRSIFLESLFTKRDKIVYLQSRKHGSSSEREIRFRGRVARQWSAKPRTAVRIRSEPLQNQ